MKETLLNFLIEIAKRRGMVTDDNLCIICSSPLDIQIKDNRVLLICSYRDHCLLSLPIKENLVENQETEKSETTPIEFKDVQGKRLNEWEYNRIRKYLEVGLSLRACQRALRVDNIHISLGTLSKIKKTLEKA